MWLRFVALSTPLSQKLRPHTFPSHFVSTEIFQHWYILVRLVGESTDMLLLMKKKQLKKKKNMSKKCAYRIVFYSYQGLMSLCVNKVAHFRQFNTQRAANLSPTSNTIHCINVFLFFPFIVIHLLPKHYLIDRKNKSLTQIINKHVQLHHFQIRHRIATIRHKRAKLNVTVKIYTKYIQTNDAQSFNRWKIWIFCFFLMQIANEYFQNMWFISIDLIWSKFEYFDSCELSFIEHLYVC